MQVVVQWVGHRRDTVKECLRKRRLDVIKAKRIVQDRSEWREFVRGYACGVAWWLNP